MSPTIRTTSLSVRGPEGRQDLERLPRGSPKSDSGHGGAQLEADADRRRAPELAI